MGGCHRPELCRLALRLVPVPWQPVSVPYSHWPGPEPRFPFIFTSAAAGLAALILLATFGAGVDVIQLPMDWLKGIEASQVDEAVTAILLVIVGFFLDHLRGGRLARRAVMLERERLRVVEVTMRTVQDIVNNCLNQLQLVRIEAEGHVADETLVLFDQSIQEAAAQLTTLSGLKVYAEQPMGMGPGLRA
jgi:hypothetical protein